MPTTKIDNTIDTALELYEKSLVRVMSSFQKRVIDIASKSKIGAADLYDTATFALNKNEMVQALVDSGYNELAGQLINTFPEIAGEVKGVISAVGGPDFKYSQIDRDTFKQLAGVDLSKFNDLGQAGVSELHFQLFNQAVASAPFSTMVSAIEAAATGVMTNQAKTQANTAMLSFSGQVMIKAGEEVGFDTPESLWKVQGPSDSLTRDVCVSALRNPIRTREEWTNAPSDWGGQGYFGPSPGGWNCRHWLVPHFGEDVEEEAVQAPIGPNGEGLPVDSVDLSGVDSKAMQSIAAGLASSVTKYGGSVSNLGLLPKGKKFLGLASGKNIKLNRTEISKAKVRAKERHDSWLENKSVAIATTRKNIADPRRKSLLARNEAKLSDLMASNQFSIYNVASDPAAAIVTHEGFHNVYNVRKLKSKWEASVKSSTVSGSDMMAVSEYGASDLAELFAEVGTAIEHNVKIPESLKNIFLEVVK